MGENSGKSQGEEAARTGFVPRSLEGNTGRRRGGEPDVCGKDYSTARAVGPRSDRFSV